MRTKTTDKRFDRVWKLTYYFTLLVGGVSVADRTLAAPNPVNNDDTGRGFFEFRLPPHLRGISEDYLDILDNQIARGIDNELSKEFRFGERYESIRQNDSGISVEIDWRGLFPEVIDAHWASKRETFEASLEPNDRLLLSEFVFKKGFGLLQGDRLPDRTGKPLLEAREATLLAQLKWPGGNLAIGKHGEKVRIFSNGFSYGGSKGRKIQIGELELDNAFDSLPSNERITGGPLYQRRLAVFPEEKLQSRLTSAFSVFVDRKNRLWVLDHGNFGSRINRPVLTVYSLPENGSSQILLEYVFSTNEVPVGSMLNDIDVDETAGIAYLTDTGPLNGKPAIVVVKFSAQKLDENASRANVDQKPLGPESVIRILEGHDSVMPHKGFTHYYRDYLPNGTWVEKAWTYGPRINDSGIDLGPARIGLNGIALDHKNQILYFAPTNRGQLFRINTSVIKDILTASDKRENLSRKIERLGERIERFADITATDGIAIDESSGDIYLTDQEHDAIVKVDSNGRLTTVLKDKMFRWPVSIRVGPDGLIYFTCFPIPDISGRLDPNDIDGNGPFPIFRFDPRQFRRGPQQ